MRALAVVSDRKAAALLLHPLRSAILRAARQATTCTAIAREVGVTPQLAANHVRELVSAGLMERVASRQRRNFTEGVYQAAAAAFALAPEVAGPAAAGVAALGALAAEADRIQRDAADLYQGASAGEDIPSLTLTVDLALSGEAGREPFARDLAEAVQEVVRRHHVKDGGDRYRVAVVGYPRRGGDPGEERAR